MALSTITKVEELQSFKITKFIGFHLEAKRIEEPVRGGLATWHRGHDHTDECDRSVITQRAFISHLKVLVSDDHQTAWCEFSLFAKGTSRVVRSEGLPFVISKCAALSCTVTR